MGGTMGGLWEYHLHQTFNLTINSKDQFDLLVKSRTARILTINSKHHFKFDLLVKTTTAVVPYYDDVVSGYYQQ